MTEIGPHLLGRNPSPYDERDYRLENFLEVGLGTVDEDAFNLITMAGIEAKETTVTYKHWASTVYPDVKITHWWKVFDYLSSAAVLLNPPDPPPTPTPGTTVWTDPDEVLDQGNYGTCVGNGYAQWGNSDPVEDHYVEKDARAIYYETTVIDGSPDDPDAPGGGQQGATVRSGAKAMKNRDRMAVYAFADNVSTIVQWIKTKGPVVIGTDWLEHMFSPDADGRIHPTGQVAGGHCYLAYGYDENANDLLFLNSWGSEWGNDGRFLMSVPEFTDLFDNLGEACTAVELGL